MDIRRVKDWALLPGAWVEIRKQGAPVCRGLVDVVSQNGDLLWIFDVGHGRRLFEKAAGYEAWATENRVGFHYKILKLHPT